ncbi:MAG: hypothetical protein ACI85O_001373 [Saprospiraceae bacterium]|jgi:hypothetical protein
MENSIKLSYHHKLNYRKNSNILAKGYRTIYFNTQKNANSSMKAQFVEIFDFPKSDLFPKDIHHNYNFPTATQNEVNSEYRDFLKFAILRNPWERLYSCYKNKIEKNSSTGADFILECSPNLYVEMPFDRFVEVVCEIPDSEADFHFCSQIYMLLYPDGTFPINYLCNIENLAMHLEEIKSETRIPFTTLSKLNHSKKSDYEAAYMPELIEKVSARYKHDIQLFNYKFGEKNEAFPFGHVTADFRKKMADTPMMLQILREKNREMTKEIAFTNIPLVKKTNDLNRKLRILQKDYNDLENSLSWKITAPLRNFIALFRKD